MQVENHFIYFPEQCKYCTKGINTTYCDMNQRFIDKLSSMIDNDRFYGSLDFKCDYFCFDKTKYNELNPGEVSG